MSGAQGGQEQQDAKEGHQHSETPRPPRHPWLSGLNKLAFWRKGQQAESQGEPIPTAERGPNNKVAEELRSLLEESGLQYQLPLARMYELLTPETRASVDGFQNGIRDQRGEEDLLPPVFRKDSKPQQGTLPLVFIGNAHYPLLQKMASERGFATMITSADSVENLNRTPDHTSQDEQNGLAAILNHAKRYGTEEGRVSEGYPMLVVGDTHATQYKTHFPSPQDLQKLGIQEVHVYAEDIDRDLASGDALSALQGGFWGKRNVAEYATRLEEAGIRVTVKGIEPRRGDSDRLSGYIRPRLR